MVYRLDAEQCRDFELSSRREWLLCDGRGGYAMGTVSGANTRRYHGHLVSAVEGLERYVLLYNIEASVEIDGLILELSTNQFPGAVHPQGHLNLERFQVADATVSWEYGAFGNTVGKYMGLLRYEKAGLIIYENFGPRAVRLKLRPLVQHKFYHGNYAAEASQPAIRELSADAFIVEGSKADLRVEHVGGQRTVLPVWYHRFEHLREFERGLPSLDDAFCPCELVYDLAPEGMAHLYFGAVPVGARSDVEVSGTSLFWSEHLLQPLPDEAEEEDGYPAVAAGPPPTTTLEDALTWAALKFIIKAADRATVIAGYPWFTDWGRDTMISLPGMCLHTPYWPEAKQILLGYRAQLRQGLIPNRIVEDREPEYNTADATLWFVHAAYRTLEKQWDEELAGACATAFHEIFDWHCKGTLYGIGVDPADGLLRQGEPGVQLTWMDAKVGDDVITPRHGKAVEINGLWINALRVMVWLAEKLGESCDERKALAEQAEESFERKFWSESHGYFLDVVEPNDASLRPNQAIAMSLPFVQLDQACAEAALAVIRRELLTPRGLRTLSPNDSRYRGRFEGSMPERDRAYHQGTVWPWLLGPYVTALVRYTGDKKEAKQVLRYAKDMLEDCGLGGIAEVYDGDPPHRAGGCPWQAWSVAEILRAWVEDVGGD